MNIPKVATSALFPFDLESSLRQTAFLFPGRITESESIWVQRAGLGSHRSAVEEAGVSGDR